MFGNTGLSSLGIIVSRALFLIFAYLDIFCSLGVNFSLFLFLIIMYCSHFSVLSSRCSEMCLLSPAISILCKLYNGRSFSSWIGCFTWSCHVFLILYSTILVLRNCFAWHLVFSSRINVRNICLSCVCSLNCVHTNCPFAC